MAVNKKNNPNDFPLYLFYQGKNYEAWKFFGAHAVKKGRGKIRLMWLSLIRRERDATAPCWIRL